MYKIMKGICVSFLLFLLSVNSFSQELTEKQKKLFEATIANDTARVLALIKEGVSVNFGDQAESRTPLMIASANGNLELMKAFLDKGLSVDTVDKNGTTAIFYAILRNQMPALQFLIKQKADINHKSATGLTPLMGAARYKRAEMIPLLLTAGARVDEQNESQITALQFAVAEGDAKTVRAILAGKPDINLKDRRGNTAIINALTRGGYSANETVPMLLELGANPNDTDSMGWNAIMIAVIKSRTDTLIPLLKAGANPYQKNNRGEDTFDLVKRLKRTDYETIIRDNMSEKYKSQ